MRLRSAVLGCTLLLACGDTSTTDPRGRVVQIVSVVAGPPTLQCRGGGGEIDVYFNVRMVNTTRDTVFVDSVATHGTVVRSSYPSLIGRDVWTFGALHFQDPPPVLRSGDGDVTYTAIMSLHGCLSPGPGAVNSSNDFVDVYLTLLVHTSKGEYASAPITLRQVYQ